MAEQKFLDGTPIIENSAFSLADRFATGHILLDNVMVADTVRCIHGGEQFISLKGSGMRRGFCTRCMGRTCGAPEHDECLHWEKRLDLIEQGALHV